MSLVPVIDPSVKVPGAFVKISLGVGPSNIGDAPRKNFHVGNKTSSGTGVIGKLYAILSADDAKTLWGAGSELHLMAIAAFAAYKGVTLYQMAITSSVGVAASATLTFTGPATSAGTVEVTVGGRTIQVPYASGAADTAVAALVEAAIDDQTDWGVTASVAAAVVTVTAKHAGPRGNYISLRASISSGTGVGVTASAAYLGSGATSDDPQAALDAIAPERMHYIVAPYQDATQLAKFKTHADLYAGPDHGRRDVFVFGSIDSLANTTTVATGLNAGRGQVGWHFNADDTPAEIAAGLAAKRSREEAIDPAANLDGYVITGLRPQVSSADWPTQTEQNSALNNGITPLAIVNGTVTIGRSVTTRSQDAAGNPSYSVLDTSKVVVPDFVGDDVSADWVAQYPNFKAAPDNANGDPIPEGVLTPSMARTWLYGRLKAHEAAGRIVDVDANIDFLKVELASGGRFLATIPVDVIEGAHQLAADVRQIG